MMSPNHDKYVESFPVHSAYPNLNLVYLDDFSSKMLIDYNLNQELGYAIDWYNNDTLVTQSIDKVWLFNVVNSNKKVLIQKQAEVKVRPAFRNGN